MVHYFASGCKPRGQWGIGTEHEKIPFDIRSMRPVPYEGARGIGRLLRMLVDEDWQPVLERGNIVALRSLDGASITLEPGGQLELSGAVLPDLHRTHDETGRHLQQVMRVAKRLDIGFLTCGFQPKWSREQIPWMPKERYAIMRRHMPKVGGRGLDMMLRTATVQANLDFASEADMARKMRIACCVQPIVTALFAASPFCDGRPAGVQSMRAACWLDTDARRTGIPACVFQADFGFDSWVEYLLDVPMYFVVRDGRHIDCTGASFRDFLAGRLAALPGEYPTLEDWALHASTAFPDVRLKQYIEMRGADAGSHAMITALPAFWKGLLYDARSESDVWHMVEGWRYEEVARLRGDVVVHGLRAVFRQRPLRDWARHLLVLADAGLRRCAVGDGRGVADESVYLVPLWNIVEHDCNQSCLWMRAWQGSWERSVDPLFVHARHGVDFDMDGA